MDITKIKLSPQRQLNSKVAGFIIACISEFAASYNLTIREASNYLKRYKSLDFLTTHYDGSNIISYIPVLYTSILAVCSGLNQKI